VRLERVVIASILAGMFPWMTSNVKGSKAGARRRAEAITADLRSRAATLYRLGFSVQAATARLDARVAWEFEPESKTGPHRRPPSLEKAAIAKLVKDVFDRKPS
jgi:hypothetical protein